METLSKHCKALELDKILAMLSSLCGCDDSKNAALSIVPCNTLEEVKALMQNTSDAYKLSVNFGYPSVTGIKNITEKVKRAEVGSSLSLGELLEVSLLLRTVASVCKYIDSTENASTSLDTFFEDLIPLPELEELISDSVLSEDELADTASDDLRDIRRKIRLNESRIRDQLDKMISSPATSKFLQDQLITMRDGRFVVPVKTEYRNEIKGMVHDTSASGATVFIEPAAVVEANNVIRILKAKEREEMNRIIAAISSEVGRNRTVICENYDALVKIDLIFSKVKLASKMHASVPELNDKGIIKLINARHPLIDQSKIVPTSISLGETFDTLVVTGPNTGGKTVTLKSVGLMSLMVCCGLMIPASDGSNIAVFDNIFADIGDEQSIEQDLSTFSAHITNIIGILENCTRNSLVLLDELGAGTDPVEGAALAVSIIEKLRKIGAGIIATTHYPEIKMYALQTEGVENACCEFDVASLKPTYRLLIGVPGRSNAFAISKRLGMSDEIVSRAAELVSSENSRFEDVVSKLETSHRLVEEELEQTRIDRIAAERSKKEIDNYKRDIELTKNKEIEAVRAESRRMIETLNEQAHKILDELEDIRKAKDDPDYSNRVSRAKSEMKSKIKSLYDISDPIEKSASSAYKLPRPLKSGDSVLISTIGKEGVVISEPDASGRVNVRAGIIKTTVNVKDLRLIEKSKVSFTTSGGVSRKITSVAERSIKSELDIRGENAEEGIMDVDAYLDGCVLSGVKTVTIIHGKGTGVLRAAIRQHLKSHKLVRTFRPGVFGEGEDGVTVVELK